MSGEDVSGLIGQSATIDSSYNRKDLITYAIGIGCDELRYVYENDGDFEAFPTYPFVLAFKGTEDDVVGFPSAAMQESNVMPGLPGSKFVLDGERQIEIIRPISAEGEKLKIKSTLVGIHQKGKGALVETTSEFIDEEGKVCVKLTNGTFVVGAKGFTPEKAGQTYSLAVPPPKRAPDAVCEMKTSPTQAHVYRLSGDYNPLHIDPMMAQMNGFKEPILHGLCSLGHAAHAVLKTYGGNEAARFRGMKCRFASPVLPGQTLVTEMWKEGNGRVIFLTKVKETNKVVISNAYVDLAPEAKL
uniref:MaoC-like domain-containing protein n=1 Tax=Paramoeba aestuarina TaxID=180227 RepID=A0A7S4NQ34_9EUKA|mmetsp:Transcript_22939/g.35704  ORF Transcript_22939/g.35704 Transcript_22939/m.35704 type:complete len:300 (+) Transcript_22939:70-969(+)|eukprot:CAMPEP_0201509862 /NCGR_PEP_ID=MMETSP0161_2-20130828/2796_1 /ASSEMBLY_ACC=CAM_ASM_000251 /TAXON_ID=180227 /ORGANISM="Neoparamoeba aestuarina, Strain SoJaBio B1-5/56/2" /LENGTH=299 /DNA_ID=CAMNT_0047904951 /DNA_START=72 /DNA_END=971 /DNA_ORIENTATION=-